MKKRLSYLVSLVLCFSLVFGAAGCSNNSDDGSKNNDSQVERKEGEKPEASGKQLIVGTMANSLGLPVHWAEVNNYFKDAGLDVKVEIFATGAPINEAMAAGNLDVAVSGMASVYALATGLYTYIGDGVLTSGGEAIYARADSPIAQAGELKEGIIGSKETVEGCSILGPLATTAHYQAIKYVEAFGLTADDFQMVSMDYAQAYQAFITGEGDLVAIKMPYSNQLEEAGYVRVSDMNKVLDSPIIDTIFTQKKVAEERAGDLELFLDCFYRASEEIMKDEAKRREVAFKWYSDEGITYSEADMDTEIAVKDYLTLDQINSSEYPLGQFMVNIGAFYVDQDMISKEDYPKVEESIDKSLIENVKKWTNK